MRSWYVHGFKITPTTLSVLKDMYQIDHYQTTTKHTSRVYISLETQQIQITLQLKGFLDVSVSPQLKQI